MREKAPLLALLLALTTACGTPGRNLPVELEDAPTLTVGQLVSRQVGALLGADPERSRQAEALLTTLDGPGRAALLEHAARIPDERDPRWLHVLDENHALGPLTPPEEVAYLCWKASRPEGVWQMKAEGRLVELARRHPDALLDALAEGGRGAEALAVALALAGRLEAVPPLLARYRGARSEEERRVAAESLALLVGDDLKPRLRGSAAQIEADAGAIDRWYRTHRSGG